VAGDDNALPTCGLRAKVRRLGWATLTEHKWINSGERRGARLPLDAKIIAAMDNDAGGARLIEMTESAVRLSGRQDLKVSSHCPSDAKDWNEVLKAQPTSFPTVHISVGV